MSPYIKIKPSEINQFLEDGGRTLVKAGAYELKDGIKNGTRSFVLIGHDLKEVYLIPQQTAESIAGPFALMPDFMKAKNDLERLMAEIRQKNS